MESAGDWSLIGDSFAVWITFAPDGRFDYVFKPKAKPIIVLSDAWGIDADRNIQVLAERFGGGTMPVEDTFHWQIKQNKLLIESLYDCYALPYEGKNVFFAGKPDDASVFSADNLYY